MKQLYHYLKTREKAPLRKLQALIEKYCPKDQVKIEKSRIRV